MKRFLARLFFIFMPALLVGLPVYVVHPGAGIVSFCLIAGVGLAATKSRIERGEGL